MLLHGLIKFIYLHSSCFYSYATNFFYHIFKGVHVYFIATKYLCNNTLVEYIDN